MDEKKTPRNQKGREETEEPHEITSGKESSKEERKEVEVKKEG